MSDNDQMLAAMNGDPNDPATIKAKLNAIFARWGRPATSTSSAPDTLDSTPGAGSDGGNAGYRNAKPAPGSSEMSAGSPDTADESTPARQPINLERAGHVPRSLQPQPPAAPDFAGADLESHVGLPVGMPRAEDAAEPGSTEDLENHAESSVPGMFLAASRSQKPSGARAFLTNVLGRLGNMGYAISGGDPRAMRLKEQGEQFEEEMQREKADPNYQARVAAATTPDELEVSRGPKGDYQYVNVDRFSGRATPTGISAPMPEKSPAQVLNEFVQNNPDALTPGTEANRQFHEIAEAMRAFPSNQAEIHANAQMYVGRLGVQRAIVQADGLIRAMQGRGITDMASQQASALNEQLKAAAEGWAKFYTDHPYLQAMGIGPDAEGQAQFMAGIIEQLKSIGLEANETVQKIPGAAKVVPSKNQVPIIGPAANSAGQGQRVRKYNAKTGRIE